MDISLIPYSQHEELDTRETAGAHVPALFVNAGQRAQFRFIEFFTANIRNPNTRGILSRDAEVLFVV